MLQPRNFILFCTVLLVLACPREETFDPSEHPPSPIEVPADEVEAEAVPEKKEGVRLLDAGAEPRELLRYDIPADSEASLDMIMAMRMKHPQEMEIPAITIKMHLTDVKVDPEGFQYRFSFDEPTVAKDAPDVPADRREELRRDLAPMGELGGHASLDRRGMIRDVSISELTGHPELNQFINELEQSIRTMTMPLPEEPVGVGASWEMIETQHLNELTFQQHTKMTLRERDGGRLVIESDVSQSADTQEIPNPQLPPDAKMIVREMTGSASGVSYVDLGSLLPYRPTTSKSSTSMKTEIQFQDQRQQMDMVMEVDLTLQPAD